MDTIAFLIFYMTDSQPLVHKRIVVTRSPEQADALCARLETLGAVPIRFPAIQFEPLPAPELDEALAQLDAYDWLIFTSGNAVRFFIERLEIGDWRLEIFQSRDQRKPISRPQGVNLLKIAAVGSATQNLLAKNNIPVDFVPERFTGEQLVLGLGDVSGKRVLLPRAKIGRPEIVVMLRERGAIVDDIALYDTITAVPTQTALAELDKGVDVITFTSPSSVRNFLKILDERPSRFQKPRRSVQIAVIGPSTAEEVEKFGLTVDIMPNEYTIDGLIDAIAQSVETPREEGKPAEAG